MATPHASRFELLRVTLPLTLFTLTAASYPYTVFLNIQRETHICYVYITAVNRKRAIHVLRHVSTQNNFQHTETQEKEKNYV